MAVDANKTLNAINDVVSTIAKVSKWIVGFGFILMLAVVVIQQFGVNVPLIPTMAHEPMLYYAGAYWLITARFS